MNSNQHPKYTPFKENISNELSESISKELKGGKELWMFQVPSDFDFKLLNKKKIDLDLNGIAVLSENENTKVELKASENTDALRIALAVGENENSISSFYFERPKKTFVIKQSFYGDISILNHNKEAIENKSFDGPAYTQPSGLKERFKPIGYHKRSKRKRKQDNRHETKSKIYTNKLDFNIKKKKSNKS